MQITRVSNQNSDYSEENDGGELILNGSEEDPEKVNNKIATNDSVCLQFIPMNLCREISFHHFLSRSHGQNALLDLLGGNSSPVNVMMPSLNPSDKQYSSNNTANNTAMSNNQDLLDLLGGLGSDTISTTAPVSTIAANDNNLNNTNGNNILSMLPATNTTLSPLSPTSGNNILSSNLFDDLTTGNSTNNSTNGSVKITALDKNGLNITLVPNKSVGDGCLRVVMLATNNSLNTLEQYLFQAAVPKSFTLQMLSPSGSVLPPGGTITQEMRLTNSAKVSIRLRIPI